MGISLFSNSLSVRLCVLEESPARHRSIIIRKEEGRGREKERERARSKRDTEANEGGRE
jgi:hypothetical protein